MACLLYTATVATHGLWITVPCTDPQSVEGLVQCSYVSLPVEATFHASCRPWRLWIYQVMDGWWDWKGVEPIWIIPYMLCHPSLLGELDVLVKSFLMSHSWCFSNALEPIPRHGLQSRKFAAYDGQRWFYRACRSSGVAKANSDSKNPSFAEAPFRKLPCASRLLGGSHRRSNDNFVNV